MGSNHYDAIRRDMYDNYASTKAEHQHDNSRRGRVLKNPNTTSPILPSRDLPELPHLKDRKTMGNNQNKIINVSERFPLRKKSSSSNTSVSKIGDVSSVTLNISRSRSSFHGTTSHLNSVNTEKIRRNSSDSGYNSSGKVCETQTGLTNGLQRDRVNLEDNKSCGKSPDFNHNSYYQPYTRRDSAILLNNKPALSRSSSKQTANAGRDSVLGRSTSRTSLDLEIGKPHSYSKDRSMSVSPIKSPKSGSDGLVGLQNLGNTCFMNSILQCLSHCSPLRNKLLSSGSLEHNQQSKMKGKLLLAFADLIKVMWTRNKPDSAVSPHSFKTQIQRFSPRFVGYEQQDSQEFLRFLLEGLNEDLNKAAARRSSTKPSSDLSKLSEKDLSDYMWLQCKSRDDSLVTDLFCGQIKSTLTCTKCKHRSVTFDPFWDLSLSIPRHHHSSSRFTDSSTTLLNCLTLFTKKEELDGDEKPKCEKCKTRQRCQKQIEIHRFPRILVIHLKRFSGFGFRSKLQTDVDFPLNNLDMSRFASNSSDELPDGDSSCVKYNLFAVSNHSGSAFGGHYTAYCKHPRSKEWHSFNDSRVGALSSSSVRGSQAYVLFYEREES